jgi:pimeloyl-ACP methyl ester carboxylesterase
MAIRISLLFLLLLVCCGGPPGGGGANDAAVIDASVPSADGVPIQYHAEGKGEPALVFIHCWSCDSTYWAEQVRHFAPLHRVVTLDLGGHGRSGPERGEWSIASFARDVEAVVKKLDLKRVVLLGHSMGGPVALEAARLMPERVVALVPVDTIQDAESKVDEADLKAYLEAMEKDFKGTTDRFVRTMFLESADPALVDRIASDMASAPPAVAIGAIRSGATYDARESLQALKIPIHAINSEKYPLKLEVNRRYAPQFLVTVMPGTGHFPMLEKPDEFSRVAGEVIASVAPAAASGPADAGAR